MRFFVQDPLLIGNAYFLSMHVAHWSRVYNSSFPGLTMKQGCCLQENCNEVILLFHIMSRRTSISINIVDIPGKHALFSSNQNLKYDSKKK